LPPELPAQLLIRLQRVSVAVFAPLVLPRFGGQEVCECVS